MRIKMLNYRFLPISSFASLWEGHQPVLVPITGLRGLVTSHRWLKREWALK